MIPPIANKFVAGETRDTAVDYARSLNEQNVGAILNLLGEHYTDSDEAAADAKSYQALLQMLGTTDIRACLSVKPSQVGLLVNESVFRKNMEDIVQSAAQHDRFVWLDMEDHTTTDSTIKAYVELAQSYPGVVGVCLQANLKRTKNDLEHLIDVPGKIRLVKGAYDPPPELAYTDRQQVTTVYKDLLEYLFIEREDGVAVGTHDQRVIEYVLGLHEEHDTSFEIQMLKGVRETKQFDLGNDYEVWQYVPYGERWISYFYRRVSERKENVLFALRAIIGW